MMSARKRKKEFYAKLKRGFKKLKRFNKTVTELYGKQVRMWTSTAPYKQRVFLLAIRRQGEHGILRVGRDD